MTVLGNGQRVKKGMHRRKQKNGVSGTKRDSEVPLGHLELATGSMIYGDAELAGGCGAGIVFVTAVFLECWDTG